MKMTIISYNYKVGYYTHEGSDYIELQHDKKFSDVDLTEMIAEATIDTIKKMKKTGNDVHCFKDIFENHEGNLIKYLIEKFGFKKIKYELCWDVFGWASVFDKLDWDGDRCDHLDKITDMVNKAGFARTDDDYLRENHKIEKRN
jgi:hypothetical protein